MAPFDPENFPVRNSCNTFLGLWRTLLPRPGTLREPARAACNTRSLDAGACCSPVRTRSGRQRAFECGAPGVRMWCVDVQMGCAGVQMGWTGVRTGHRQRNALHPVRGRGTNSEGRFRAPSSREAGRGTALPLGTNSFSSFDSCITPAQNTSCNHYSHTSRVHIISHFELTDSYAPQKQTASTCVVVICFCVLDAEVHSILPMNI